MEKHVVFYQKKKRFFRYNAEKTKNSHMTFFCEATCFMLNEQKAIPISLNFILFGIRSERVLIQNKKGFVTVIDNSLICAITKNPVHTS